MSNVPTITPGPDDTEHTPEGATETIPLITNAHTDKQSGRTNDAAEISDEEAYAKLKAKRAERRRKKLIRRGIAAGIVGAIALIAIVATLVINAQPQGASGPVTDMVTEGTFTTTVEAKGQLKPISSSVVSPSVDGTVDSINVQAGQSVNEGDVLMTIKNDELDRNVAEAQRAVAAAQEDLANAQKAAAAAQATPTTDVDGASAAAGISAASADTNAVSAAQRSLASAQANLDQANAKAASRTVTAPSSGSIVELNAKVGATVTGGMIMGESDTSGGKQCMQIADLSKMKVTVQVGEKDIAKIAVGQSANVTYPAFPDIVSQGTVTAIASVANSDSNNGGGSSSSSNSSSGGGSNNYGGSVVAAAQSQLGVPYVWGGTAWGSGLDCSGLTSGCWKRAAGIWIGRTTWDQIASAQWTGSVSEAQAGDVYACGSHVAIATGGGGYIHAPQPGEVVCYSSLSWYNPFYCALRWY